MWPECLWDASRGFLRHWETTNILSGLQKDWMCLDGTFAFLSNQNCLSEGSRNGKVANDFSVPQKTCQNLLTSSSGFQALQVPGSNCTFKTTLKPFIYPQSNKQNRTKQDKTKHKRFKSTAAPCKISSLRAGEG